MSKLFELLEQCEESGAFIKESWQTLYLNISEKTFNVMDGERRLIELFAYEDEADLIAKLSERLVNDTVAV